MRFPFQFGRRLRGVLFVSGVVWGQLAPDLDNRVAEVRVTEMAQSGDRLKITFQNISTRTIRSLTVTLGRRKMDQDWSGMAGGGVAPGGMASLVISTAGLRAGGTRHHPEAGAIVEVLAATFAEAAGAASPKVAPTPEAGTSRRAEQTLNTNPQPETAIDAIPAVANLKVIAAPGALIDRRVDTVPSGTSTGIVKPRPEGAIQKIQLGSPEVEGKAKVAQAPVSLNALENRRADAVPSPASTRLEETRQAIAGQKIPAVSAERVTVADDDQAKVAPSPVSPGALENRRADAVPSLTSTTIEEPRAAIEKIPAVSRETAPGLIEDKPTELAQKPTRQDGTREEGRRDELGRLIRVLERFEPELAAFPRATLRNMAAALANAQNESAARPGTTAYDEGRRNALQAFAYGLQVIKDRRDLDDDVLREQLSRFLKSQRRALGW